MEKFLFSRIKVEMWVVLLLAIAIGLAALAYGTIAYNRALEPQKNHAGILGKAVEKRVRLPGLVGRVLSGRTDDHVATVNSHDLKAGFTYEKPVDAPNYVLVSRYDGDIRYSVIELVDEADGAVMFRREVNNPATYAFPISNPGIEKAVTSDPSTMRANHPILTPDGGLMFHFENSALYKTDACGNVEWRNDEYVYHHSLTVDADGNYWAPGTSLDLASANAFDPWFDVDFRFHDDQLVKLSPDGKVLFSKSVLQILSENGLTNRFYDYDTYQTDPIHLNDIEPVLTDSAYWKKGDVFISLGHLNMLLLYRPSEDKLVWFTQANVMHQHDIDILDDHRIIVFNNQRRTHANGVYVQGHNVLEIYDFETGEMTPLFPDQMAALGIATLNQGLEEVAPDGSLMIEETNSGRLVKLSADGDLVWQYANRAKDGTAYTLNWSRYVPRQEGDAFLQKYAATSCKTDR